MEIDDYRYEWDLRLNDEVPMEMSVSQGALWSLIPAMVMVVGVLVRTGLEDQMLGVELEGYETYAEQTRYRLDPQDV